MRTRPWIWVLALVPATALSPATAHAEWGLGLRTSAQSISPKGEPDQKIGLVGGGLQVRWHFLPRWGVELTSEALAGDAAAGAFHRESSAVTLSGFFHITPMSVWDCYGLLGVGGTEDTVTFVGKNGDTIEQQFSESHVHLGAGLERRFGPFALGAELRIVVLSRKDKDVALPADAIPPESGGAQLNLAATYYF